MQLITGNTFPVRAALARLGGKPKYENGKFTGWEFADDLADEARRIVGLAPAPKPKARAQRRSAIYTGETCACCGRGGQLIEDLEDGMMKHYGCCDIPSSR